MNTPSKKPIDLRMIMELDLGQPIGQMRSFPVRLGQGCPTAILCAYSAVFDVDPYIEMFFFPNDTLKLAVVTLDGKILWKKDLGPGVVPGHWFCPVQSFDLNGDGVDEIWFVNNVNVQHPLGLSGYRLERLDGLTGKTMGQWLWPSFNYNQTLSHMFRNFIIGGFVHGQPVLVTAQGTYQDMHLQGWNPDMTCRWSLDIPDDGHGARGSHVAPVVDLDQDGSDEILWGERCIRMDNGKQSFCADENEYNGHSDIIQPVFDSDKNCYFIYTCRESCNDIYPRVVLFDDAGNRVWCDVDKGHMDMGWVGRLGVTQGLVATAIRIGNKVCGPDGRFHDNITEFAWEALSGKRLDLNFSTYRTIPVDINGDGYHEMVRGQASGDGEVLTTYGEHAGTLGGAVSLAHRFGQYPGTQLLSYNSSGVINLWTDQNALE